ncbi:MAG: tyrosine-type recombinase/integrase [Endomicrobium sp.]|uniref:tyrosine-type recombinase/integrase n=1 Tax=Candidatus Endomicrobiellum pyrsonymphae TaxID=1408203 RepID=UPI00357F3E6D|nr:tyrosine-type recombinase/integrase [Endomicrobium sp.]
MNNLKTVKKIRKIALRHKFVTTLINSGQLIKKISAIVGHASITMTERKLK